MKLLVLLMVLGTIHIGRLLLSSLLIPLYMSPPKAQEHLPK